MFHWLRDHRRAEARERPFPPAWEAFVCANVAHYSVLDDAERAELRLAHALSKAARHEARASADEPARRALDDESRRDDRARRSGGRRKGIRLPAQSRTQLPDQPERHLRFARPDPQVQVAGGS